MGRVGQNNNKNIVKKKKKKTKIDCSGYYYEIA